ncbi:hypothetical protein [Actinospongicola halichondriae]|uniref:hypothetical protein n=1 Tax=Actinospongicola halichondriae TaxID=3236844 RepID=UPI003D44D474
MTPTAATQLAESVVEDGFAAHRAAVAALLAGARRRGVSETLVGIVGDPTAPRPVRERALGRLVFLYVRKCDSGPDPVTSPVGECVAA